MDNSSSEDLSKIILRAIKAKDFSRLKGFYADAKLIKEAMKVSNGGFEASEEELAKLAEDLEENLKEAFERLLEEGESEFDFSKITFKTSKEVKTEVKQGLRGAKIEFIFNAGEEDLNVSYEAVTIGGKWYLTEDLQLT